MKYRFAGTIIINFILNALKIKKFDVSILLFVCFIIKLLIVLGKVLFKQKKSIDR